MGKRGRKTSVPWGAEGQGHMGYPVGTPFALGFLATYAEPQKAPRPFVNAVPCFRRHLNSPLKAHLRFLVRDETLPCLQ